MNDWNNQDWLTRLTPSNPEHGHALEELRLVLRRGLSKALKGRASDESLIDDLAQDSLIKVLSGLPSFRGDSKFTTWAVSVAVRVAFTELRRSRWRDVSFEGLSEGGAALEPVTEQDPGVSAEKADLIERMRRVIDTELSERQRFVLVAELNGVPQIELCDRLGISTNAIYKLAYDARKKLKKGLLSSGVTESDVREVFGFASE
ncbi:MAG: sigma-70 family RNA polymerase sigma factor [Isosphaeraceae bacterium]|nr:sigma-70 family RNA polymerase sigma factor [Isosphaeraceae bacterium]